MSNPHEGDGFTGYHLRVIEETLGWLAASVDRIERKIDALGSEMSPADKAALIARLTVDKDKIDATTAALNRVASTLNQTKE